MMKIPFTDEERHVLTNALVFISHKAAISKAAYGILAKGITDNTVALGDYILLKYWNLKIADSSDRTDASAIITELMTYGSNKLCQYLKTHMGPRGLADPHDVACAYNDQIDEDYDRIGEAEAECADNGDLDVARYALDCDFNALQSADFYYFYKGTTEPVQLDSVRKFTEKCLGYYPARLN